MVENGSIFLEIGRFEMAIHRTSYYKDVEVQESVEDAELMGYGNSGRMSI